VWDFLKNLKIELVCYLAKPLLSIYPKESKSAYNRDTYTPMFIVAVFTTAKRWNQHRGTSNEEWIKKMYIYTVEYYPTIKKYLYL
jgi:hypothetical protein